LPYFAAACVSLVIGLVSTTAFGQTASAGKPVKGEFCSGGNWGSDERVSVSDLREMTVASTGRIDVDAGKNGGVSVIGEDRGDVLVRACVQAWGTTGETARSLAGSIKITTGGTIKADGATAENWSVSFQIVVPRSTDVEVRAHNGGISISNIDGRAQFETTNGGVNLSNVAGDFKGRTVNGGVRVALSGSAWKGSGLDVTTTNGGISLDLPDNFAANVEAGTVNGGFKSDIPALNVTTEDLRGEQFGRMRSKVVNTVLNGGGAPIRVVTTNGGIKISTLR